MQRFLIPGIVSIPCMQTSITISFPAHKIDNNTLILLKEKDLSDIGIIELGPRLLIQSVIGKLKLSELFSNQPDVVPSTSMASKDEDNIEDKKPVNLL